MSLATPGKLRKLQVALYVGAKRQQDRRFHQLYDKVYRADILAHAYAVSRSKGGAPGVDGVRFEDIESYGVERWLEEVAEELRTGSYQCQPVRRVLIPKAGGGERPLGIPTVKDRVVQTAAKFLLEPIFEADFDESAFGYRPKRSAVQAVQKVHGALLSGKTEVVDADLSKYFETIPHAALMKSVARRVSDGKMLKLVRGWLKAPVEEKKERGGRRMTGGKKSTRGTPQGGVVSPLLANIYMHRFIKAFRQSGLVEWCGAELVNYADDFVVLCERGADVVLVAVRRWMERIGLTVNEEKTRLCKAWQGFDFLGFTFGPLYSRKNGRRYLGVHPSKQARQRLKDNIRAQLRPGNQAPWEEVRARLNRSIDGWASYFSYGSLVKVRKDLDWHIGRAVQRFLCRRHKVRGCGTRRFRVARIHGELGVRRMSTLPTLRFVNAPT